MSTTAGGSLNACLPTSGSRSTYIPAVAVLSETSKQVVCRFAQNVSRLPRFYKISFQIFEYFAYYGVNNILNSFACSSGARISRKKTCFFSSPLNRSWLQPARVPRGLLRKFCYSLFFAF